MSLLFATLAIPILMSRMSNARSGLLWTIGLVVVFNLLYLLAVRFVYPHLL